MENRISELNGMEFKSLNTFRMLSSGFSCSLSNRKLWLPSIEACRRSAVLWVNTLTLTPRTGSLVGSQILWNLISSTELTIELLDADSSACFLSSFTLSRYDCGYTSNVSGVVTNVATRAITMNMEYVFWDRIPALSPVFKTTISTIPLQDMRTPTAKLSRLYSPNTLEATNPPKTLPTSATTTMQTI
ncbi:hypothetical protein OGAPHI_003700 [Ogataea philodendri]|uniref:Uncharacterized protein n=1 Tax=Ogataea philodendri TaxID=1378263 RepID=A0A9P8P5T5_9ASCO|nr:uncharacterized protein OGAPHI_003700 [Ogataea philodendri]KAH3665514.1 hypothetical protein OGAPHI_003700 [Ogataea philodendri]